MVHGGQIDEGLEGRARLPPGLDGAIELVAGALELIAAAHGEHAAGMRIEGDDGAADLGNLTKPVAGRGIGLAVRPCADRLDQDDVPPRQHVRRLARTRAHPLVRQHRPRPGELGEGDPARHAEADADGRPASVEGEDDGEPPGADPDRRRICRERSGPGRLRRLRREGKPADGAAPAVPAVIGDQAGPQGLIGDGLEAGVDRGAHGEPAGIEHLLAEAVDEVAPDLLAEIAGIDERRVAAGDDASGTIRAAAAAAAVM